MNILNILRPWVILHQCPTRLIRYSSSQMVSLLIWIISHAWEPSGRKRNVPTPYCDQKLWAVPSMSTYYRNLGPL